MYRTKTKQIYAYGQKTHKHKNIIIIKWNSFIKKKQNNKTNHVKLHKHIIINSHRTQNNHKNKLTYKKQKNKTKLNKPNQKQNGRPKQNISD